MPTQCTGARPHDGAPFLSLLHLRAVLSQQLHKKKSKITCVNLHPLSPHLLLTSGNDHSARLFDVRQLTTSAPAPASAPAGPPGASPLQRARTEPSPAAATASGSLSPSTSAPLGSLGSPEAGPSGRKGGRGGGAAAEAKAAKELAARCQLAAMPHPRVVSSAYWSPLTGRRILTTCLVRPGGAGDRPAGWAAGLLCKGSARAYAPRRCLCAQDNRLRVWDYAPYGCLGPADRDIVHRQACYRAIKVQKAGRLLRSSSFCDRRQRECLLWLCPTLAVTTSTGT